MSYNCCCVVNFKSANKNQTFSRVLLVYISLVGSKIIEKVTDDFVKFVEDTQRLVHNPEHDDSFPAASVATHVCDTVRSSCRCMAPSWVASAFTIR